MKFKVNKSLLPLKLVLFTFYGAASCILPYLTVHMRQIGITVEETAIIYAILPIVSFLGPPTAGFLADRLGRYQPVLVASLLAVAAFHTSLLAIPHVSIESVPTRASLVCGDRGLVAKFERCSDEIDCITAFPPDEVEQCVSSCLFSTVTSNESLVANGTICSQTAEDFDRCINLVEIRAFGISSLQLVEQDLDGCLYSVQNFSLDFGYETRNKNDATFLNFACPSYAINADCLANCSSSGNASMSRKLFPECSRMTGNHLLTFSTYFLLRVIGAVFLSITFTLMDATCFALIKKNKGEYGKQKLWSILATAIFSPITGLLIDHMSRNTEGYSDYSPAFYVFDGLIVCTILLSFRLSIELDNSSEKMIQNLKRLMKKVEVVAFLLMIFILGSMWGFLETFLFWYMLDLHSPKYLLGLTVTIGSGLSIPVLFSAEKILKKTGNIPLLICAFAFYAVRMVGYSFIYNPWWSLIFESFEVITINLMWVAAATYGNSIAPEGLIATMQGTMGGIHYGIGRGAGSFIGGLLMQSFGARTTFQIMGVISLIACIFTVIYYLTYFRHKHFDNQYRRKESITNGVGLKNRDDSQLQHMLKLDDLKEKETC